MRCKHMCICDVFTVCVQQVYIVNMNVLPLLVIVPPPLCPPPPPLLLKVVELYTVYCIYSIVVYIYVVYRYIYIACGRFF